MMKYEIKKIEIKNKLR